MDAARDQQRTLGNVQVIVGKRPARLTEQLVMSCALACTSTDALGLLMLPLHDIMQVLVALPETVDLGDGMGRKQSRGITVMRYVF